MILGRYLWGRLRGWVAKNRENRLLVKAWKANQKESERRHKRERRVLEDRVLEQLLIALERHNRVAPTVKLLKWNTKI